MTMKNIRRLIAPAAILAVFALPASAQWGPEEEKNCFLNGSLREAFALKDRLVFLGIITDQTENVFPMVPGGKGISELIHSEDL